MGDKIITVSLGVEDEPFGPRNYYARYGTELYANRIKKGTIDELADEISCRLLGEGLTAEKVRDFPYDTIFKYDFGAEPDFRRFTDEELAFFSERVEHHFSEREVRARVPVNKTPANEEGG